MTVTIYHNPRCSKSRQTLALVQKSGISVNIIEYLKSDLSNGEIKHILEILDCSARNIIRKTETAYKTLNLDDDSLSEDELVNSIVARPELLQRPIVLNGQSGVIGRPPEKVLEIL